MVRVAQKVLGTATITQTVELSLRETVKKSLREALGVAAWGRNSARRSDFTVFCRRFQIDQEDFSEAVASDGSRSAG